MNENTRTSNSTESQILLSAEKLFLERGFNATSTTDIAKDAGCNQALVHYYFRTKDNLYKRIFDAKIEQLLDFLGRNMKEDGDIFQTIDNILNAYFDFLHDNPKSPFFILNEMVKNPDRRKYIREAFLTNQRRRDFYRQFCDIVEKAVEKGEIYPIDPLDLFLNALSLSVFSFITAPVFIDLLGRDTSTIEMFIEHRKSEIIKLLTRGIKKEGQ